MKKRYALMVALLLAIITIGAVSASDDISSDQPLAADESGDEVIAASSADDALSASKSFDSNNVRLYIYNNVESNDDANANNNYIARVYDRNNVTGTVSLSIDNVQYYSANFNDGDKYEYVSTYDFIMPDSLKTGSHNVVLSYLKTGVASPYTYNQTSNFTYSPSVYYPDVSVGETAYVYIEHLAGSSGTATLYNYTYYGELGSAIATASIVDGKARIPVSGLKEGYYEYYLNMTINGKNFDRGIDFSVEKNAAGFSSSVSASQITTLDTLTVKVNGPKSTGMANIYVDGKFVRAVSMMNGAVSEEISALPIGQHIVKVMFYKNGKSYSNSFVVDVKQPVISVALKTVTVKKSAKKLVLQATVKVNSKAVSGKKVTFKFNGKTYSAKTNKKGVAKVTVKKNVLKKLKVGKKVTYQAQYLTKTVKKTAKVKK